MDQNDQGFPVFKIDLSELPENRFVGPATHFKEQIVTLMDEYGYFIPSVLTSIFSYFDWFIKMIQTERYMEIEGMANVAGVDFITVLFLNYIYEFSAFCTSIIVKLENG